MSTEPETFILRTTLTSPFGRKIRMVVDALGLSDRVTIQTLDPYNPDDSIRRQNPLGKMPCLVREDGSAIFDSGVIVEFLQDVAGSEQMIPLRGPQRFDKLVQLKQADGMIDAGASIQYEKMWHQPEQISEGWLEHQRGKILRGLAAFEAAPPPAGTTDAVTITLACVLAFLDIRGQVAWRPLCPHLVAWLDEFVGREPAFQRTVAPAA
jgi:glutathione S-transferase